LIFKIVAQSDIDCLLVGDSLAMVMHGHATTQAATVELMALHTEAVARGADNKFIITDLPFLAHRQGLTRAMRAVEKIVRAGAHAVKLERVEGNEKLIKYIVESGVPVMGHLGMTPQSVHQFGGFRVQAKDQQAASLLSAHAQMMQDAGCFAVVLECVPGKVAQTITRQLTIPTIGIGAGAHTDGQVLVLQDMLGADKNFKPKFLKTYWDGFTNIQAALNNYDREVKENIFPAAEHDY
jgi:3-methyl-2-oxobutanoate hydroxymethyltransferase